MDLVLIKESFPVSSKIAGCRMFDYVISHKTNEIYAKINYGKHSDIDYFHEGTILEFKFPDALYDLIVDYDEIVSSMALSILDEVEEKIQGYDLRLKNAKQRMFCIVIKNKKEISFFTKYPTSKGYRDLY